MYIKTAEIESIRPFAEKLYLPPSDSHKGQNGKLTIIGGSSLFHAAPLWAAEIASHFVDLVHLSTTAENQKVFINLKARFQNGIIIKKADINDYVEEDDCILIGPGMVRAQSGSRRENLKSDEGLYARELVRYLLTNYPDKRFVLDAGALQMMDKEWFLSRREKPILTPHLKEFEKLFGIDLSKSDTDEKINSVEKVAKKYNSLVILKAVDIIISDGAEHFIVHGGNAGLTKGGSGDCLAGLVSGLYTKNDAVTSAVMAAFLIKKTADFIYQSQKVWYNTSELNKLITETLSKLFDDLKISIP